MKKIFLTVLLLTGLFGCEVFNLTDDGGECPDSDNLYFDINGMQSQNVTFDASNNRENIAANTPIDFNKHFMFTSYDVSYHADNMRLPHFGLSLINKAYALSCVAAGGLGSKETLKDIIVTTNFNLDDDHKLGDTINSLLNIRINNNTQDLSAYLKPDSIPIQVAYFNLTFKEMPRDADTISVNIELKLDNGEHYMSTTAPVIYN